MSGGWTTNKFVVKHYRRGDSLDGEAFGLVPDRDPAAVSALEAYAQATPDPELAKTLRVWIGKTGGSKSVKTVDKLPSWVLSLSQEVKSGTLSVEAALFRIAGYAVEETIRSFHSSEELS